MTPARCVALAVVFGACWLGAAPCHAQVPPPQATGAYPGPMMVDGPPGYEVLGGPPGAQNFYRTPQPMEGIPNICDIEVPDDGTLLPPPRIFAGSGFLRAEYLNWTIGAPGDVLLGAQPLNNPNPREPFIIFSPGTNTPQSFGFVPDLNSINLSDTNGLRVTGGFDFAYDGSIEISAFMLAKKNSGFLLNNFGSTFVIFNGQFFNLPNVVATSVLDNTQPSDTYFVYNESFEAIFSSRLWGGEANYLIDYDTDGLVHFRPMAGVRYLNLSEQLIQQGLFQPLTPTPAFQSTIDSSTINHLGGGQIGLRGEFVSHIFEFGADAKFMVMANNMIARVNTNELRSPTDPFTESSDIVTQMAVGTDLQGWGVIKVGAGFALRVGYNFMWLGNVTRPQTNIYYNETSAFDPPGFVVKRERTDLVIHGVSLGADFRW